MTLADLSPGESVFLDANVFVYHFEPHALFGPPCTNLLEAHEIDNRPTHEGEAVRNLSWSASSFRVIRLFRGCKTYEQILAHHPHLKVEDIRAATAFAADYLANEEIVLASDVSR